ncbi:hypothetical protein AOLI_G00199390 [Acnodon oligacanthus]
MYVERLSWGKEPELVQEVESEEPSSRSVELKELFSSSLLFHWSLRHTRMLDTYRLHLSLVLSVPLSPSSIALN